MLYMCFAVRRAMPVTVAGGFCVWNARLVIISQLTVITGHPKPCRLPIKNMRRRANNIGGEHRPRPHDSPFQGADQARPRGLWVRSVSRPRRASLRGLAAVRVVCDRLTSDPEVLLRQRWAGCGSQWGNNGGKGHLLPRILWGAHRQRAVTWNGCPQLNDDGVLPTKLPPNSIRARLLQSVSRQTITARSFTFVCRSDSVPR